jgi:hypothetical protein
MHDRSEATNPPKHRFIDSVNERYGTLSFCDERHFKDMSDICGSIRADDKVTTGMLAALGIQYGNASVMSAAMGDDHRAVTTVSGPG